MAENEIVSQTRDLPDIGAQVSVARQVRIVFLSPAGLVPLNSQLVHDAHRRRVQDRYAAVE
jgi:hypothetical protein